MSEPQLAGVAWPVHIGEAARLSGVSAKMVRHYEGLGLLPRVARTDSGYRQYGESDVHTLRFIKRARNLGFSLEETATLLGLWRDKTRESREVKRVAQTHIDALESRIAELQDMVGTLKHLAHCCSGDNRPDCPILNDLAEIKPVSKGSHPSAH